MRYAAFHHLIRRGSAILQTARTQNLFEPVLNALMGGRPEWAAHPGPNLDLAREIAGRARLDVAKGKVDRMMPGIVARLNIDAADLVTVGVQQTPTFFFNGKPLLDFGPEGLFAMARSEVEAL